MILKKIAEMVASIVIKEISEQIEKKFDDVFSQKTRINEDYLFRGDSPTVAKYSNPKADELTKESPVMFIQGYQNPGYQTILDKSLDFEDNRTVIKEGTEKTGGIQNGTN